MKGPWCEENEEYGREDIRGISAVVMKCNNDERYEVR